MKKFVLWGACLCAMAVLTGCQTTKGAQTSMTGVVSPGPGEGIVTNQAILMVDASGSMYPAEKFAYAHELAHGFWAGAPEGRYHAGTMSYGSTYTFAWVQYPSQAFDRVELQNAVAMMRYIGGSTPLPLALQNLAEEVATLPGRTAIVLYSDGKADPNETLNQLANLKKFHQGELCVHTVQFGDDDAGGKLLADMVDVAGCGSFRHADSIADSAGMDAFLREVFFGPAGMGGGMMAAGWQGIVYFDVDKSYIKPDHVHVVDEAAALMKADPTLSIRVEGHTDSTATEGYNMGLADRRAKAVADALVARGIAPDRISTVSVGESQPASPNTTRANRALNRRAILITVK